VRDDDGAEAVATQTVAIEVAALQPDPEDPGKTMLVVGGTSGNDEIKFVKDKATGGVRVQLNTMTLGPFAPTGRLVAYGLEGNDDITVETATTLPVELYGGPGHDALKALKGNAILVGGPGTDQLVAGSGRDLLIGGEGTDGLAALGDDDILIAGSTPYDEDPGALRALLAEWTRKDLGYAERVEHLRSGGGRNGTVRLDAMTVTDDGERDRLESGPGRDWFFASAPDRITGRKAGEILTAEAPSTMAITWSPSGAGALSAFQSARFSKPSMPDFAIEDEPPFLSSEDAASDLRVNKSGVGLYPKLASRRTGVVAW
jgi:hypothetical protein